MDIIASKIRTMDKKSSGGDYNQFKVKKQLNNDYSPRGYHRSPKQTPKKDQHLP